MANIGLRVSKSLHLPSGMVDPRSQRTVPKSPAEPSGHQNFALHPATSARVRDIHRASAATTSMVRLSASLHAGGHGGPPLRGVCVVSLTVKTKQMDSAQRGGMLSGRAASRTNQLPDSASQHTFGGWQGGHHPRWQYTYPRLEFITLAIGDGRPT